ncbi:hypothetical protein HYT23_02475 [Candidatus Pacearchaeota archaeon]|nr:hypothetical protein [Candidatus Pacearchaeota archaeon]
MSKALPSLLKENPTHFGSLLYRLDKRAHNLRFYIKRHMFSIGAFFLLIYTVLNLFLVYIVRTAIVSVFVTIFLFFLSLERLIIHLKSRIDKEAIENKELQIRDEMFDALDESGKNLDKLQEENRVLISQNDYLKFQIKYLKEKLKNER